MVAITCQYGSCLETVGDNGIVVSLRKETPDGEKRAIFCCAAHAAASLQTLAKQRREDPAEPPIFWRQT